MSDIPREPDSLIEEADIEPEPGEDYRGLTPRADLAGEASEHDVAEQARPAGPDEESDEEAPDRGGSADEGSLEG